MRFLVSPEFSAKLAALSASDIQHVANFLEAVGVADEDQLLEGKTFPVSLLEEGVYVSRLGKSRIYFTFGTETEGEYVLLLDATTEQPTMASQQLFATRNPRTNSSLNPKLNSSINPQFNASLNPKSNASINPQFNASLNPKFNASINPRMNRAFGGPYCYSTDLAQEAYIVRANDNIELVFNLLGEHVGQLVRVNEQIKVQFTANNDWVGYFVRANEYVLLRFSVDGNWIGLVV
jgi:hypothetical protein